jgi:hypothetical protein
MFFDQFPNWLARDAMPQVVKFEYCEIHNPPCRESIHHARGK